MDLVLLLVIEAAGEKSQGKLYQCLLVLLHSCLPQHQKSKEKNRTFLLRPQGGQYFALPRAKDDEIQKQFISHDIG